MKRLLCAIALFGLMLPGIAHAQNDDISYEIDSQMNAYDFSSWQAYYDALPDEIKSLWGDGIRGMIVDYAEGDGGADFGGVLETVRQSVLSAIREHLGSLAAILAVALISGIVGILTDGNEREGLRGIVTFICLGMCIVAAAYTFTKLASVVSETTSRLSGFMEVAVPVLSTLMTAVGSIGTSAMLRPLTAFLSGSVANIFSTVIIPATLMGGAIAIVSSITGRVGLNELVKLIKTSLKWVIGAVFTVYLGMITVQGVSVAGVDSVVLKSAKYTIDKTVPIIGSAVSGTLDTVLSCTVLIKNATGIAAVLIIASYVLSPLLYIGGATLSFRVSSALCEPVADPRIPSLLSKLADMCNYLFAAVIAVGLMFVITIGLTMAVGNV